MKVAWIAAAFAVVLTAGLAAMGCGPEEKYCWAEHVICKQVIADRIKMCEDQNARDMDAGRPPSCTDAGVP